jgi:hypothetical protein
MAMRLKYGVNTRKKKVYGWPERFDGQLLSVVDDECSERISRVEVID